MLATSLVIGCLMTILFLIVGIVTGWVARDYMMNHQDKPKLHPEFFDQHGNVVPDEVLAISFNPDYFDYDDEFDDED